MFDDLAPVAAAQGGYLFRHQLNALGFSDDVLSHAVRTGQLVRPRHGTYVPKVLWDHADPVERFAIETRAVLDKLGGTAVATHVSAAALHGFDLYGVDLAAVHVTRLDGRGGRREAGVVFHQNAVDLAQVVEVDGRPVSSPLRTVLETSTTLDVESGMVLASSALRAGTVAKADLEPALDEVTYWPGARRARLVARLSDGRLESVGEVRSLHMMWRHGVPYPELQHVVELREGRARLDFYWEHARHAGEFDGAVKYGRANPFPEEPGRAVFEEKRREDGIRALGYGMTRWTWADLAPSRQAETCRRLLEALAISRRLRTGNAVHVDLG